jgi:hypothetical protein
LRDVGTPYDGFLIPSFFHSWSECTVDNTDDGYVGDNRDGDEQWYQYRTQDFCANAAFSLYGIKKGSYDLGFCGRHQFINSFFTYGGADNLLKAAGVRPKVYYSGYDDQYDNETASNAMCVEVDNPNNNQDDDNDQNRHRKLPEDNNNGNSNGYVSSLGCDAEGNFIIAGFSGDTCDGNYYSDELDTFRAYNRQHSRVGCHKIWSSGFRRGDRYAVATLLNNSWSCDMDLYPYGCPDPFGQKERWSYAIQTLANGGNAQLAYRNMLYKWPLRILSIILIILGTIVFLLAYWIRNKDRILAKGCKTRRQKLAGYLVCLWEDLCDLAVGAKESIKSRIRARREKLRRRRERRQKRKETKRRSKRSKKHGQTEEAPEEPDIAGDQDVDQYDRYDSRIV